jgi:putative FmdB family regulatory protein
MPTYEYVCRKCGHEFEAYQSIKDEPLKRCPKCKGAVKRKISMGAGLLFKGSGFYITDYRSEGYKSSAKAEKESAAPKIETKAESKMTTSKPAASAAKT